MAKVTFKMPYSGSIVKFKEVRKGDVIEVTETEKNILSDLGVIEGSKDHPEQAIWAAKEAIKERAKNALETKEEKTFSKKGSKSSTKGQVVESEEVEAEAETPTEETAAE